MNTLRSNQLSPEAEVQKEVAPHPGGRPLGNYLFLCSSNSSNSHRSSRPREGRNLLSSAWILLTGEIESQNKEMPMFGHMKAQPILRVGRCSPEVAVETLMTATDNAQP